MTKHILISGGAVHAYLDDIKIITNKFKGGLMADLVGTFVKLAEQKKADVHVTYLCSKNSQQPWWDEFLGGEETPYLTCVHHNGIDDYMEKVLALTPDMDAVVLGAAVANLIPKNKIEGKFPSHNYKEGDTIPIDFTIAPRIIDRVKEVAPKTLLFGYKLLENVGYDELISAAYGVLLESKAVTVFANDTMDLMMKYAVTKERGVHPIHNKEVAGWILDRMDEKYYQTVFDPNEFILDFKKEEFIKLVKKHKHLFTHTPEGYIFGCVAKRIHLKGTVKKDSFFTTIRGKNEIESCTIVKNVDHEKCFIEIPIGYPRASLNTPLLHKIFEERTDVDSIVHYHGNKRDLITQAYATPGTNKDAMRSVMTIHPSFNIKGHGCILSFDKEGNLLK